MHYGSDNGGYLKPLKSTDGTTPTVGTDGSYTLADSTTYYVPWGGTRSPVPTETYGQAMGARWAAALAATVTIEVCIFPERLNGSLKGGPGNDVTDWDATAGNWIQVNPTDAYVPTAGTNNTSTAAVVTAGGTNAGGCVFDIVASAGRRYRTKFVVTTGAKVWLDGHGKLGG